MVSFIVVSVIMVSLDIVSCIMVSVDVESMLVESAPSAFFSEQETIDKDNAKARKPNLNKFFMWFCFEVNIVCLLYHEIY